MMGFLVSLPDGLEYFEVRAPLSSFEPPIGLGAQPDVRSFWDLVPDDLHDLPEQDRRFVETLWQGLVQHLSDLLSRTAHMSVSDSLLQAPILTHRRWQALEFSVPWDLRPEAGAASSLEQTSSWVIEQSGPMLSLSNNVQDAVVYLPLRSEMGLDGALHFELSFHLDSVRPRNTARSWAMFGWESVGTRRLKAGLWAGVSSLGEIGLFMATNATTTGSEELSPERWQSKTIPPASFQALRQPMTLRCWALPQGSDPVSPDRLYVLATLEDSQGSAISLEHTFDLVAHGGKEFESIPVVNSFGVRAPNSKMSAIEPVFDGHRSTILVRPVSGIYYDTSLLASVEYVPLLQHGPASYDFFWRHGVDYVSLATSYGRYLRFRDIPTSRMWAEVLGVNEGTLKKRYGHLTRIHQYLEDRDSEYLRHQIVGALHGLTAGPHLPSLATALGCLLGAPVALSPGVVRALAWDAGGPCVVIEEPHGLRSYPYPKELMPRVEVGQAVSKLEPLVHIPEIHDWTTRPALIGGDSSLELDKYRAVLVQIPSRYLAAEMDRIRGPLEGESLLEFGDRLDGKIKTYLFNALAVWCAVADTMVSILSDLSDALDLDEELYLSGRKEEDGREFGFDDFPKDRTTLLHFDALTNGTSARYDEIPPYIYDEPLPSSPEGILLYDQGELDILASRLHFTFSYEGSDTGLVEVEVFDGSVTLAHGEQVTVVEPDTWESRELEYE